MKSTIAFIFLILQPRALPAAEPRAVFALPLHPAISMEWVLKPLDGKTQDSLSRHRFRLAIDGAGNPWFADGANRLLVNPLNDHSVLAPERFSDFVWMEGGDPVLCTKKTLGLLKVPSAPPNKQESLRTAPFFPALPLSHTDCRLFSGGSDALYVIEHDPAENKDEIMLLSGAKGAQAAEKLVAAAFHVEAVAGDGMTTFVGAKHWIYKLSSDSKEPQRYFDAKNDVTGLAYSKETGLFYTTRSGVGFVDSKFQLEFIKSTDPEIVLRGTDLYIRLSKNFAVVKITGADRFKEARWPETD